MTVWTCHLNKCCESANIFCYNLDLFRKPIKITCYYRWNCLSMKLLEIACIDYARVVKICCTKKIGVSDQYMLGPSVLYWKWYSTSLISYLTFLNQYQIPIFIAAIKNVQMWHIKEHNTIYPHFLQGNFQNENECPLKYNFLKWNDV